jgi:TatD DNase family protein
MHLIDTHTHLTDKTFRNSLDGILDRAQQAGICQCITVGTNLPDSRAAIELARSHQNLFCTIGVHPHDAAKQPNDYIAQLRTLAPDPNICALGEVGLDYHYDFSDRPSQHRVLAEQLRLARELDLPVVFHCREAFDDALAILDEQQLRDHPLVFHCFGGTKHQADQLLDRGFYISFTGTITFKKPAPDHDLVRYIPLDRIMLETDCPYLSPEPARNTRPNEPALLIHIAQKLADLKNQSLEKIAQETTQNSRLVFKLTNDPSP